MICNTADLTYKAIKKDKARGHYCPECNNLLRYRRISGVDEGTMWDGRDYYCFKCHKRYVPRNEP